MTKLISKSKLDGLMKCWYELTLALLTALRKTMVRAHRQAWAWQDEWHGLTMDDIRQIEKQTQEALKMTMAG